MQILPIKHLYMKVVDFIGRILTEKSELSREDHAVCRALIGCMSDNEIEDLEERYELDWHLSNFIEEKKLSMKKAPISSTEHNKDWHIYFKILQQRTYRKVGIARNHLHTIFPYMEWKSQRQILRFSLLSNLKVDRIWALEQLYENWNLIGNASSKEIKYWFLDIENVWNKFYDKGSAFVILKHMSYELVIKYEQKLSEIVGYKQVALRLGTNVNYNIDRARMSDIDYLYVMAKLLRPITKQTADMILSKTILQVIDECTCPMNCSPSNISLLSDNNISLVIWCLGRLNHPKIIMEFYENDQQLQSSVKGVFPTTDDSIDQKSYWELMCKRVKEFFPLLRRYDSQIIEQLIKKNPSLAYLIDKLQLELE